jgi:hypothetical protein
MVYLIRSGKFIKIGFTTDIRRRLETLQIGNPIKLVLVGLIPGDTKAERRFQDRFGAALHRGEWFKITTEMQAFIDQELSALNETAVEHIAANRRALAMQVHLKMQALEGLV